MLGAVCGLPSLISLTRFCPRPAAADPRFQPVTSGRKAGPWTKDHPFTAWGMATSGESPTLVDLSKSKSSKVGSRRNTKTHESTYC